MREPQTRECAYKVIDGHTLSDNARIGVMGLEKEKQTYKVKLPILLADEGKFALIKDDNVVGVFDTYADALQEGYRQFGVAPFLVKQIQSVETVQFFTRDLASCHT